MLKLLCPNYVKKFLLLIFQNNLFVMFEFLLKKGQHFFKKKFEHFGHTNVQLVMLACKIGVYCELQYP